MSCLFQPVQYSKISFVNTNVHPGQAGCILVSFAVQILNDTGDNADPAGRPGHKCSGCDAHDSKQNTTVLLISADVIQSLLVIRERMLKWIDINLELNTAEHL